MKNILLLLCTMYTCVLHAQELDISKLKVFKGEQISHNIAYHDQGSQGYSLLSGKITGEVDFDFSEEENYSPSGAAQDIFITKYGEDDALNWLLILEGSDTDNNITAIQVDEEDNVYLTGSFTGTLDLSGTGGNLVTTNTISTFLSKYNSEGVFQWGFQIGTEGQAQFSERMFLQDDRLILQMVYSGEIDVDPGPGETILDDNSNAVIIYNLEGALVNAYTHRGGIDIEDAIIDSEGNLYISGQFAGISSIDFKSNQSLFAGGLFDGFVAKYNSSFDLEWVSRLRKTLATNNIYQIALDGNEDLIAIANLEDGVAVGIDTTQTHAHFLLNVSKEGEITNPVEFLPEGSFVTDLEIGSDGNIITTGCFINAVDIDPTVGTTMLTPENDAINFFLAYFNPDYSLIVSDQIYGTAIPKHSLLIDKNDKLMVLTDFQGTGKIAFGHNEVFEAEQMGDFLMYTLEINNCTTTFGTLEIEACEEAEVNGMIYDESGVYEQVLVNEEGCDSLLRVDVLIYPEAVIQTSVTSCGPFEYDGGLITESGMYVLTENTINGCDSMVFLELEVVTLDSSITINVNELIANEMDANTYQWYECGGTTPIEGATDRIFMPGNEEAYQVLITKDGCSYFSECAQIILFSIEEIENSFSIIPNPTSDFITIEGANVKEIMKLSVHDIQGRYISEYSQSEINQRLDLSHLHTGTYYLRFLTQRGISLQKIVKM